MARDTRQPLIVTMGDPAGIGPEITIKAWQALRDDPAHAFAIIAPMAVMTRAAQLFSAPVPSPIHTPCEIASIFGHNLPVIAIDGYDPGPGMPSDKAAPAITHSIQHAVELAATSQIDAVITNPIAKDILYQAGFKFPGHTEYLGALTANMNMDGPRGPVMMLAGGGLRVALATVHMSLLDAAKSLNTQTIMLNAQVLHRALIQDFGIKHPRIAVTGLNPHAGENGALGEDEIKIINPATDQLRKEGLNITDAQPADTLFHAEARMGYDAVLAMYHDQGLIPVKTLDFHGGVNVTLGLPIIRTSPDHGTAFGIAGKGRARPDSLIAAIKSARNVSDNRRQFYHG